MANTDLLALPEITENQGSKYVTHNEALRTLEAWIGRVLSRTTTAQPSSPAAGDTYIVPAGATGTDWSGQDDSVAHFYGGAWHFLAPVEGPLLQVQDEGDARVYWDGAAWVAFTGSASGAVITMPVVAVTADYNVQAVDQGKQLAVTDSTAGRTITLPSATSVGDGFTLAVYLDDATNPATIAPSGSDTIDGAANLTLSTGGDATVLVCDGTTWRTAADAITPSGAGTGDVTGPASSTDNELPRYDGTTGKTLQTSGVLVDDDANLYGHGQRVVSRASNFTLAASDAGRTHECASGAAFTVTVPDNATVALPVGYSIALVQTDGNAVTVSPAAGVTIRSKGGLTSTNGQWSAATLYKRGTDEWVLIGDLA